MNKPDFAQDLGNFCRAELLSWGAALPRNATPSGLVRGYLNVTHRMIEPAPRRSKISTRLFARLEGREVAHQITRGFLEVTAESHFGENLNGRLSEKILNPDEHDWLLNDWGIYHLHLGPRSSGKSFAKRKDDLLYAWVTPNEVLCIDIMNHRSFSEPALLDTLFENWPGVLKPFRTHLLAVSPGREAQTAERVRRMRQVGVSWMWTAPDGGVYVPPGGGYATARNSTRVNVQAAHELNRARAAERWCRDNETVLREQAGQYAEGELAEMDLHLDVTKEGWFVVDRANHWTTKLPMDDRPV